MNEIYGAVATLIYISTLMIFTTWLIWGVSKMEKGRANETDR